MNFNKLFFLLLVVALIFTGCQPGEQSQEKQSAKYVFYFIGDGVSLPQLSLTEAYLAQKSGNKGMQQLNQSKLSAHGWFYPYADNRFITGSAAVGTALATGHKTTINTISKSPDHSRNYESIATKAHKAGYKVGIISTVSIDHATPATFYAHVNHRDNYYKIGQQMLSSEFDLFAGGGLKEPEGENGGQPDLYARESGINILRENKLFMQSSKDDLPFYFAHERLQDGAAMPFAIDMDEKDLSLTQITRKSIELLDNEQGFFLMLEGGKIDWACHANDAATTIQGIIDFDNAVGEALKFAQKHPSETLIVVLGDHETGGLTLGNDQMDYETDFALLQHQTKSYEMLFQSFIPLIDENGDFEHALKFVKMHLGLGDQVPLTEKDRQKLKKVWKASINYESHDVAFMYGSVQKFLATAMQMLNTKAGVGWTTKSHTGLPVIMHAEGVGASNFEGIVDNTDIPKLIWQQMAD